MGRVFSAAAALACAGTLILAPLAKADSADAVCAQTHADPVPGYSGPLPVGIECRHQFAPEVTWTAPPTSTIYRFWVYGAGDSSSETRGGRVVATLDLTPGTTLTLRMGGDGEASAVLLGEEPLLVAGGGDGLEPNYITPTATDSEAEEPGSSEGWPWEGEIFVEWTRWYEGEDFEEELPQPQDPPAPDLPQLAHCVVPHLRGLKPIAARKVLEQAQCTLGKVSHRPARRHRRGRVVHQFPVPGASLPVGAAVKLTVGRRP